MGSIFRNKLSFSLGNGCRARFWVDPWVEGRCLYQKKELVVRMRDVSRSLGCFTGSKSLTQMNFLNLWIFDN